MKKAGFGGVTVLVAAMCVGLSGCMPPQQSVPSASIPLAGGKVWPDTTVTRTIDGLGEFQVSIRNGQVNVVPPKNLNVLKWSITSIHKTEAKPGTTQHMLSAGGTGGDRDGDGVPDCEDWCPDLQGSRDNRGCPEGVDGIPPIRWEELMSLEDESDKLVIEFGVEGCPK